ncbi:MAG: glycosyltransferase family 4 protein [Vicinamibacterales bacterium]
MTGSPPLLVTPGLGGADGVSQVAALLAATLAGDGPAEVWSLGTPGRVPPAASARLTITDARGSATRLLAMGAGEILRRRPAILVAHLHLLPVVAPAVLASRPVAVYLHGVEAWRPQPWWRRRLLRGVRVLMANSSWTAARFLAAHPEFAGRELTICPPALATTAHPLPVPPDFAHRDPLVVIVGRMWTEERYKGHDQLLDAWPEVRRRVPGARLLVIGDGDDRPRLEARSRAEGLAEAVSFTGALTDAARDAAYRSARVFAMPSTGEGFGLVFLEAMRHGLPCVAAPGAAEEIVLHGRTGLIVSPGDREGLASALADLLGDPGSCARLGEAGALRVSAEFTVARFEAAVRGALASMTC